MNHERNGVKGRNGGRREAGEQKGETERKASNLAKTTCGFVYDDGDL